MTDYTELVKALRHCVSDEKGVTKCAGCPYYPDITGCMDRLHTDAAAAIEALQAELEKKRTADCFGCKCDKLEPSGRLQKRGKPVLLAASSMNGCEELPKRGEWIDGDARRVTARCSVCGHLRLGNGAEWANKHVHFCEVCGSRMGGEKE